MVKEAYDDVYVWRYLCTLIYAPITLCGWPRRRCFHSLTNVGRYSNAAQCQPKATYSTMSVYKFVPLHWSAALRQLTRHYISYVFSRTLWKPVGNACPFVIIPFPFHNNRWESEVTYTNQPLPCIFQICLYFFAVNTKWVQSLPILLPSLSSSSALLVKMVFLLLRLLCLTNVSTRYGPVSSPVLASPC